jgi:hypothetical protein
VRPNFEKTNSEKSMVAEKSADQQNCSAITTVTALPEDKNIFNPANPTAQP